MLFISPRFARRCALLLTAAAVVAGAPLAQPGPPGSGSLSQFPVARTDTLTSPGSSRLAQQPAATTAQSRTRTPERIPDPFWLALLVMVIGGAVGAFASDVLADGRIDWATRDARGWMLGVLGNLIVGAVAAIATLTLNPTSDWWKFLGTAILAGFGGEAILLSRVAKSQAQEAVLARKEAEGVMERASALNAEQLETFRALSISVHHNHALGSGATDGSGKLLGGDVDAFDTVVNTYATRARAEFTAATE